MKEKLAIILFLIGFGSASKCQVSTFRLECDGQSIPVGAVSGLDATDSSLGYRTRTLSGTLRMASTGSKTISIQKLKCSQGSDLYSWFSRYAQSGLQKRDLKVKQVGTAGEIVKTWKIVQAGPLNMSVPEPMDADANLVLIETLTLTYEKIEPEW